MKIFGIEFGKRKRKRNKTPVHFEVPAEKKEDIVKSALKKTIAIAKIPRINNPVLSFKLRPGADEFEQPEYDMAEIGRIEDVEAYVQSAFSKKEGLMFKEDWEIIGKNPETIKYIKQRFEQFSAATEQPLKAVLRGIGEDLIRYSNGFLVKVRDRKASGGKIRKIPSKKKPLEPVAGYFALPVSTVRFKRNDNGKILKYRQLLPNGSHKDFSPSDVIHVFFRRKKGFLIGTPSLIPVKDDIRALRRIEENIEMLVYQHLFPLYHYKVGDIEAPAETYSDGTREIDVVKSEVELMPAEGMIVTPERHEIKAVGAEGRALRAESYLQHFKQRIFAGLGVSAVDMGEGDCYSEDTETLTDGGWKYHSDISKGIDKIATFNLETQHVEYHLPNYKYEGYYEGNMVRFFGKHIDIKVTPHHEMWVCPGHNINEHSKWRKIYAKDLYGGKYNEFCFLDSALSDEIETNSENFSIPSVPPIRGKVSPSIDCNLVDFASLLGYYISEGCLDICNALLGRYRTVLSQNRGKVLQDMHKLLDKMNLSHSISYRKNRDNEASIKIYGKTLYKYLEDNIGHLALNKNIPEFVFSWSKPARQALLKTLVDGDGSWPSRDGRTAYQYHTGSKQLADDVQRLAFSLGYTSKIISNEPSEDSYGNNIMYLVSIGGYNGKSYRIVSRDMISIEKYSGVIYCYNVPGHLFVTRRNGKVTIQGNSANRATADNMSRNMVDNVKHYQRTWELFINEHVIKELLLESTFSSPLEEENLVYLKFSEIDVEAKIKVEAHAITAFGGHAITHAELRRAFGKEPLEEEEWDDTFWKLIEEPKIMMQSTDEPWSALAQAVARAQSTAPEQGDYDKEAIERKKEMEAGRQAKSTGKPGPASTKKTSGQRAAAAKTRPSNQYGTKTGPEKRKSSFKWGDMVASGNGITKLYTDLEENTMYAIDNEIFNIDWFKQLALAAGTLMNEKLLTLVRIDFRGGFRSTRASFDANDSYVPFSVLEARIQRIVNRFVGVLVNKMNSNIIDFDDTPGAKKIKVSSVFDALKFRSRFIYNSERKKARNYGVLRGLRKLGYTEAEIIEGSVDSCELCKSLVGQINIENTTIEDIPGFHPNCTCTIVKLRE